MCGEALQHVGTPRLADPLLQSISGCELHAPAPQNPGAFGNYVKEAGAGALAGGAPAHALQRVGVELKARAERREVTHPPTHAR